MKFCFYLFLTLATVVGFAARIWHRGDYIARVIESSHRSLRTTSDDYEKSYEDVKFQSEKNCLIKFHPETPTDPRTKIDASKQCVLYYLHFHKSGGTTICNAALHEGYKGNGKDNCLPPLESRNHEYEYAIQHKLTFVAQEDPFFQPNLTSNRIVYFTTIRNPYDRIISHVHHELCERKEIEAIQLMEHYHCSVNISEATLADIILDPCFANNMKSMFSNYYLSVLTNCIGDECTEVSLKEAIEKLDIMSVIMITDTPEDYAK